MFKLIQAAEKWTKKLQTDTFLFVKTLNFLEKTKDSQWS